VFVVFRIEEKYFSKKQWHGVQNFFSHAALVYCDRSDHAVIEKAPSKHLEIRVPSADGEGRAKRMVMIYRTSALHDLL
jgi:hypothetical protein